MYNTRDKSLPSRPVVPSATTAQREVDRWLAENDYRKIIDASGLAWQTALSVQLIPDPENPSGLQWELILSATVQVTAKDLAERGTLSADQDQRLIELLGDCRVPLVIRPLHLKASSEEELRSRFVEQAPDLRRKIEGARYDEVKRSLLGSFVSRRFRFDTEK